MEEIKNLIDSKELLEIKVIAGSSVDKIYMENEIIKVKIREIPENGRANKSIISLFSKTFKIPKKNIEIAFGHKLSNKVLRIVKN